MSNIKNYDRALYNSHFDAVKYFITKGRLAEYDFNVCSKSGGFNALSYLCINNIDHTCTSTYAHGLYLITLSWRDNGENGSYSFWCDGEI